MNQTLVRRVGMALGMWTLLRYKTRLCRWSSIGEDDGSATFNALEAPRWLGNIRFGRDSHHALFCPPSRPVVYRFLAPPRTRIEAWCAVHALEGRSRGAEFCISVRPDGSTHHLTERLCLDPEVRRRDRRWRQLVFGGASPDSFGHDRSRKRKASFGRHSAKCCGDGRLPPPERFTVDSPSDPTQPSTTCGCRSRHLRPRTWRGCVRGPNRLRIVPS
jgi:hypothetical protein